MLSIVFSTLKIEEKNDDVIDFDFERKNNVSNFDCEKRSKKNCEKQNNDIKNDNDAKNVNNVENDSNSNFLRKKFE